MYRGRTQSTTGWHWIAVCLVATAVGCETSSPRKPAVDLTGKSNARILYDAAMVSFRRRDLGIDIASERRRMVSSEYQSRSDRLRRRFTARIVELPRGAAGLQIRVQYQRRFGDGDGAVWRTVRSEELRKRAKKAELELGRAIEKRYRRWKAYRESKQDEGAAPDTEADAE